jgi:3-oxoacyl-[acyl-carrier-protein] synthase-3
MSELCEGLLSKHGIKPSEIKLLIPHQANKRIIAATGERLGLREDQVVLNLDRYGNTTAATIPLATRDALTAGRLKKGDVVLFAAVGAGYTAAANLWRWAY